MIYINQEGQCELGRGKTLKAAIRDATARFPDLKPSDVKDPDLHRFEGDAYWTSVPVLGYQEGV